MLQRTTIYADEGKVLTDGKIYGRVIILEVGRNVDDFYEISQEEYEKIIEREQEEKNQ